MSTKVKNIQNIPIISKGVVLSLTIHLDFYNSRDLHQIRF